VERQQTPFLLEPGELVIDAAARAGRQAAEV
jgi:hypothetical protein